MFSKWALRGITMLRTASTLTLKISREIANFHFADDKVLKNQPEVKKETFTKVEKFAAVCGVDAGGAVNGTAIIRGPWHSGGKAGGDTFERVTVSFKDDDGVPMYFYRPSDKTFWDSLHVPRDLAAFPKSAEYIRISEEEFDQKNLDK